MNVSVPYRCAEEEVERQAILPGHYDDTFAAGALWGAGWAFALVAMGEAIRERCGGHLLECPCPYVPATPTGGEGR